jgi:hypothetical protein
MPIRAGESTRGRRRPILGATRRLVTFGLPVALLVVGGAASVSARVARVIRSDLDLDGRAEQVEVIAGSRANPFGGTVRIPVQYVRVVDRIGGKLVKRRLSPRVERASAKVRDFNADGRPDVWFDGSSGNGGAAPQWFGLYDWGGRHRHVLWSYSWNRSAVGNRWAGASVHREQRSAANPGLELVLREGVLSPGDANCCPSRILVSVYAYSTTQRRYRLFDRYYDQP